MMTSKLARILYGEADAQVLSAQVRIFEEGGYAVAPALGRDVIADAVVHAAFDLVILGHTLTKDDRHHLAYMAKKFNPATRVLVLHASGKHPKVDLAIDSRRGEGAVLEAVAQLLAVRRGDKVSQAAAVA
jgi:DNA-binding NtrC family response regulator